MVVGNFRYRAASLINMRARQGCGISLGEATADSGGVAVAACGGAMSAKTKIIIKL